MREMCANLRHLKCAPQRVQPINGVSFGIDTFWSVATVSRIISRVELYREKKNKTKQKKTPLVKKEHNNHFKIATNQCELSLLAVNSMDSAAHWKWKPHQCACKYEWDSVDSIDYHWLLWLWVIFVVLHHTPRTNNPCLKCNVQTVTQFDEVYEYAVHDWTSKWFLSIL